MKKLVIAFMLLSFAFANEVYVPFFSDGGSNYAYLLTSVSNNSTYVVYDNPIVVKHRYYLPELLSSVQFFDDFQGSNLDLTKWQKSVGVFVDVASSYANIYTLTGSGYIESLFSDIKDNHSVWFRMYINNTNDFIVAGYVANGTTAAGLLIYTQYGMYAWKESVPRVSYLSPDPLVEHSFQIFGLPTVSLYIDGELRSSTSLTSDTNPYRAFFYVNSPAVKVITDYIMVVKHDNIIDLYDNNITVLYEEAGMFNVDGNIFQRKRIVKFPYSGEVLWYKSGSIAFIKELANLTNQMDIVFVKPPQYSVEKIPINISYTTNNSYQYNIEVYVEGELITNQTVSGNGSLYVEYFPNETSKFYTVEAKYYPSLNPSDIKQKRKITYFTMEGVYINIVRNPNTNPVVGNYNHTISIDTIPDGLTTKVEITCKNDVFSEVLFSGYLSDGDTVSFSNACYWEGNVEITAKATFPISKNEITEKDSFSVVRADAIHVDKLLGNDYFFPKIHFMFKLSNLNTTSYLECELRRIHSWTAYEPPESQVIKRWYFIPSSDSVELQYTYPMPKVLRENYNTENGLLFALTCNQDGRTGMWKGIIRVLSIWEWLFIIGFLVVMILSIRFYWLSFVLLALAPFIMAIDNMLTFALGMFVFLLSVVRVLLIMAFKIT